MSYVSSRSRFAFRHGCRSLQWHSITSAHVSCVAAHMPLLRNTNSISLRPYYEPGTEPEVVHLHSVTSHVHAHAHVHMHMCMHMWTVLFCGHNHINDRV